MAVRQISYFITADGITPSTQQSGGVQGDHNVTDVMFVIGDGLRESLETEKAAVPESELCYRFDLYNGINNKKSTVPQVLDFDAELKAPLEREITRFGGVVEVVLVITLSQGGETLAELYSFTAMLKLKPKPAENGEVEDKEYQSATTLSRKAAEDAERAEAAADEAEASAETAEEAKDQTVEARAALENGTTFIFDGGNAAGMVDTDGDGVPDRSVLDALLTVDGAMSDTSNNPVKNKVVNAFINNVNTSFDDKLSATKTKIENDISFKENIANKSDTYDPTLPDEQKAKKYPSLKLISWLYNLFGVDYVVERGTSGIWTYRKWASGIAECWGSQSGSADVNNAWGNMYVSKNNIFANLPFVFAEIPNIVTNLTCAGYGAILMVTGESNSPASKTSTGVYEIARGTSTTALNYKINYSVKGRWE